jgi:ribonuclease D
MRRDVRKARQDADHHHDRRAGGLLRRGGGEPYVTVDTEFLRERTYYSKLCLVQLALPGQGADRAVLVDPLAEGIDLAPLFELMRNPAW